MSKARERTIERDSCNRYEITKQREKFVFFFFNKNDLIIPWPIFISKLCSNNVNDIIIVECK